MSRTINELTPFTVNVVPKDPEGNTTLPTTARYRVDDCRTKQELIGWTALTPSESMDIVVPSSANEIIDNRLNKPEEKIITVHLDDDLASEQFSEYLYRVKNLKFAEVS